MPGYDERAVAHALNRTVGNAQARDDETVTILGADLKALRAVALARRDNNGQVVLSLTLEELDSEQAIYGPGAEQIQIRRQTYDELLRPGRLTARIDAEKS